MQAPTLGSAPVPPSPAVADVPPVPAPNETTPGSSTPPQIPSPPQGPSDNSPQNGQANNSVVEPSEIKSTELSADNDIKEALAKAAEDGSKLVISKLLRNGRQASLKLKGYLTTNAIEVNDTFGNHSIGFAFNDDSQLDAFLDLYKYFDALGLDSDWNVVDMIRKKCIYLKLKIGKNNQYKARTNVKLNPKTAANAPLVRHQQLEVQVDLNAYYSLDEGKKTCGFYFDIFNIVFDTSK